MNQELENLVDHETIAKFCRSQRLRWTGHVNRMPDARTPKVLTVWVPQWKRSGDRPKKRWMDCLEEDWSSTGRTEGLSGVARDHIQWRTFVNEAKYHPVM